MNNIMCLHELKNIDLNKINAVATNVLEKSKGVTVEIERQSLWTSLENKVSNVGEGLSKLNKCIDTIGRYLKNPLLLVVDVTIIVAKASYCICLFGTAWLIIIYVFTDDDKYIKKAKAMSIGYLILQIVGGCMQGTLR